MQKGPYRLTISGQDPHGPEQIYRTTVSVSTRPETQEARGGVPGYFPPFSGIALRPSSAASAPPGSIQDILGR
ncbi:hypothetical protein SRHO_G00255030 [Serrasalmus rhombeus]